MDELKKKIRKSTCHGGEKAQNGVDIAARLFDAISAPVEDGDTETVRLILAQGINPNIRNSVGETPLHVAAFWGREEITKLLLNHKADISAQNNDDETPLVVAARALNSNPRVIKLLLDAGSEVDIYAACLIGDKEKVSSLLKQSPDLVKVRKGFREETPLHAAASKGHSDVATLLLDFGSDIDAKNNQGDTPMHLASLNGHVPVVDMLIAKGAQINAENTLGGTPLDCAIDNIGKDSDVVKLLRNHGGYESTGN